MSVRNVPLLAPRLVTSLISRAFLSDCATYLTLARFLRREAGRGLFNAATERSGDMFRIATALSVSILLGAVLSSDAMAQQINGTPGSPSATITIDGKQLPPPPLKFGGIIKESAKDSQPWWSPRVVPPRGAPNVLLIMTDDQGYGVSGTFGGVIPTPALDRIANAGLRPVPLDRPVLADASGADHRSQPPFSGIRCDHGAIDGLPGL